MANKLSPAKLQRLNGRDAIQAYILEDFSFADFGLGQRVVDIGCGNGRHLRELRERGCKAVGVEPRSSGATVLRAEGLDAIEGTAERLPCDSSSFDGVVCSVVLPYTDERLAVAEWSRVLVSGGQARVACHGLGYALRYLFLGNSGRMRFYGLRTILNTWVYCLTGRRLPGWMGDTLYQSQRRLAKYYSKVGLRVLAEPAAKKFCGFPVFIYQHLQKV